MATLLLKKSYLHKGFKEIKFHDLWNSYGVFTTMRVIGKPTKILFFKEHKVQIIWQCGKLYYDTYSKYNENKNVSVHAFIKKMDLAYAAADIIISRAGAIAISELCCVGKPIILVPSPNVAENHQYKNAQSLVNKNAALLVEDADASRKLVSTLEELIKNEDLRTSLSSNIKKIAVTDAAEQIAKIALDLVK